MNSLSWMIYFAELSGSVSAFLTFLAVVSGIATFGCVAGWCCTQGSPHIRSWERDTAEADLKVADHKRMHTEFRKMIPRVASAMVVIGLTATVLPSRNTVYAIAASEMGETLINTPTAGKAVKALDAWLDRQIAGETDKPDADK
jgi:hypothetical protein